MPGRKRLGNVQMRVNRPGRPLHADDGRPRSSRWRIALLLSIGLGLTIPGEVAFAGEAKPAQTLRVGTSGDYAPFSIQAGPEDENWKPEGFDIDVARAYARDRGLQIEWVRFRWPDLMSDLEAKRFDIAMSGVTVRPERSLAGRFSVPVAHSGAVALVPEGSRLLALDRLDDAGVRIAVNRGGHLERVTRAHFPHAQIIAVSNNQAVLDTLAHHRADAVITDTLEAPHWKRRQPGVTQLGPFTHDTKAYLMGRNPGALAADLDGWLLEREADQALDGLRRRFLGHSLAPPPAEPVNALLAAIDERLGLMPGVAEAKRGSGGTVEDRKREAIVIERALEAAREARPAGDPRTMNDSALRALFRAQIEAAKDIQLAILASPPPDSVGKPADLHGELRPALGRIGDRIAWLVVRLPENPSRASLRERTRRALAKHGLSDARLAEIADAIAGIRATPEPRPPAQPPPPPRRGTVQ